MWTALIAELINLAAKTFSQNGEEESFFERYLDLCTEQIFENAPLGSRKLLSDIYNRAAHRPASDPQHSFDYCDAFF